MKPSDRMIEIARDIIKEQGEPKNASCALDMRIEAIVRYLDEEMDKQCQHDFVYMSEGDGVGDALRTVERCRYCGERRSKWI